MTTTRRHATEQIITLLCLLATLAVVGMLFLILGQIFINGLPSLSWHFITTPEGGTAGMGQGIANAIVGTILISFCATLVAAPFGFGTAVYMKRYAQDNGITQSFRFLLEVLSGTPSIVIGIFGFLILVIYLKPFTGGYSLIAGSIALAILIMPVIERAIEDAIERVPPDIEEASYALGANKWQTIRGITIPSAIAGIMTGFTLGFGRAAEESAIVLLTAGYTQYMPEFGIQSMRGANGGTKLLPFQDQVGTLPYTVYHAFDNAGQVKPSAGFAAAFVLVVVVFTVNITGKAFLSYSINGGKSDEESFLGTVKKRLFPRKKSETTPIDLTSSSPQDPTSSKEKTIGNTAKKSIQMTGAKITDTFSRLNPFSKRQQKPVEKPASGSMNENSSPIIPDGSTNLATLSPIHEESSKETLPLFEEDLPLPPPTSASPQKPTSPWKEFFSSAVTSIKRVFRNLKQKLPHPAPSHDESITKIPVDKPKRPSLRELGRSIIFTFMPFIVIFGLLLVITSVFPVLNPIKSTSSAGFVEALIAAVVLCILCTIISLFLLRKSSLFMRLRKKHPLLRRRIGAFAVIFLVICLIATGVFIFSAYVNVPYITPNTAGQGHGASSLTGTSGTSRSAQLAAYLASQETPAVVTSQSTPVASKVPVAQSPSAAVSSPGSIVPVKNALDVGESYWYGDNSRPCLATVYNATTLPFYFYWDMDWNRFVQVSPASTGDTFLVIFIRIEDTGNMSAIVPPGAQYVVYYKGQAYYNEPYFDTSVLDANEISYYTANFNLLPYQWIREIGQQKRDYAFLTGYNIFGQNTTVISNYSVNTQFSPPSATTPNGEGWFIKPGRSNAIDGYLIYEVPGAVATDLRDTYVQVPFNSFSSTQWRLGK